MKDKLRQLHLQVWVVAPDNPDSDAQKKILHDRSYEDKYNNPGSPMVWRQKNGQTVLAQLEGGRKLLYKGTVLKPPGAFTHNMVGTMMLSTSLHVA